MKAFLTIIITLTIQISYSQSESFKDLYPENKLFKTLKVKRVVDSFYVNYPSANTKFYDTAGRLIGDFNYYIDTIDNPFVYVQERDTLYRLKYKFLEKDIYSFEKFVFNKVGDLKEYFECRNSYHGDSTVLVNLYLFEHDDKSRLKQQSIFRSWNYSEKVKERMNVKKQELQFIDKYDYSYLSSSKVRIVVAKHSNGNRIDTMVYNLKGQLLKQNLFARHGSVGGEQSGEYVNDIILRTYKGNSILEKWFTTYCFAVKSNGDCFERKQYNPGGKEEKIIDEKGLLIKKYSFYGDNSKVLTDRYFYLFNK